MFYVLFFSACVDSSTDPETPNPAEVPVSTDKQTAATPKDLPVPKTLSMRLLTKKESATLSSKFKKFLSLPSASGFSYLDHSIEEEQAWELMGGILGKDSVSISVLGANTGGVTLGLVYNEKASFFSWQSFDDMCMIGDGKADLAAGDINADGRIDIVSVQPMYSCGPGGGEDTFKKALVVLSNPKGWEADYGKADSLSQKLLEKGANAVMGKLRK